MGTRRRRSQGSASPIRVLFGHGSSLRPPSRFEEGKREDGLGPCRGLKLTGDTRGRTGGVVGTVIESGRNRERTGNCCRRTTRGTERETRGGEPDEKFNGWSSVERAIILRSHQR